MQGQKVQFVIVKSNSIQRHIHQLDFHSNQSLAQMIIKTALSMLVNPVSQIGGVSYQQNVFGQENANLHRHHPKNKLDKSR